MQLYTVCYSSNSLFSTAVCELSFSFRLYLCASPGPCYLPTLIQGPHHVHLRLKMNSGGRYSSGCMAASCAASYSVIMRNWRLQSTHHSLERHELFPCLLLPAPQPPPHCTTNSAENTNIISTASASLRKAHDTLSITDAKSPQQAVLMCSLSAWRRERREMLESHYPPTHSNTHSHTLSTFLVPLLLLNT